MESLAHVTQPVKKVVLQHATLHHANLHTAGRESLASPQNAVSFTVCRNCMAGSTSRNGSPPRGHGRSRSDLASNFGADDSILANSLSVRLSNFSVSLGKIAHPRIGPPTRSFWAKGNSNCWPPYRTPGRRWRSTALPQRTWRLTSGATATTHTAVRVRADAVFAEGTCQIYAFCARDPASCINSPPG